MNPLYIFQVEPNELKPSETMKEKHLLTASSQFTSGGGDIVMKEVKKRGTGRGRARGGRGKLKK